MAIDFVLRYSRHSTVAQHRFIYELRFAIRRKGTNINYRRKSEYLCIALDGPVNMVKPAWYLHAKSRRDIQTTNPDVISRRDIRTWYPDVISGCVWALFYTLWGAIKSRWRYNCDKMSTSMVMSRFFFVVERNPKMISRSIAPSLFTNGAGKNALHIWKGSSIVL